MDPASHQSTLFVPKHPSTSVVDRATTGLPQDLLNRAATRLQILAWLYAFTFFMADFFPSLVLPAARAVLFERVVNWAPGFISIAVAVSVALIIRAARPRPAAVMALALGFEVAGTYWLLTGQLVFTGETPMMLLLAHAHLPPDPPSSKTAVPVPPDLDALVLSCLAKDREQRPPSARDLLQRLDAIPLQQPWTDARAREWWKAHLPLTPA
jgi:hypothetical protein